QRSAGSVPKLRLSRGGRFRQHVPVQAGLRRRFLRRSRREILEIYKSSAAEFRAVAGTKQKPHPTRINEASSRADPRPVRAQRTDGDPIRIAKRRRGISLRVKTPPRHSPLFPPCHQGGRLLVITARVGCSGLLTCPP